MKTVKIGSRVVGDGHPCYILAEAGCNHNRNIEIARKLVDTAASAHADGIKFQTYRAEKIYSKKTPMMRHFRDRMKAPEDATMYDLIRMTELPRAMHIQLAKYCRKKRIPFLSTPFDEESVDFLEELDVPAYKIAAFEITHFPLIKKVARTGKPVILSTGMSTLGDIEKALSIIYKGGNKDVILLHCVSNYPASKEDCNLRVINTLKTAFGCPVGLSDHTPGIDVARVAIAIGADLIEKHITIDQKLPGPDHHFSLLPNDLTSLVAASKDIEVILGNPYKGCTESEAPMKHIGRRSLVAARDVCAGEVIRRNMLAVKRPGYGLHPELMDVLIGAVASRNIEKDEPLTWDVFFRYKKK